MAGKTSQRRNKFTNYFDVHERVMRGFVTSGFVLRDEVTAVPIGNGQLSMEGTVECLGGIVVTVEKLLVVTPADTGEPWIESVDYSYNVSLRGVGTVFRYNGPHPNHNKFHHVHRYDVLNGDNEGTVVRCDQPTLGDAIAEAEVWYWDNRDELPSS